MTKSSSVSSPLTVTCREAAAMLGLHPNTVRRLVRVGDLRWVSPNCKRLSRAAVERYGRGGE